VLSGLIWYDDNRNGVLERSEKRGVALQVNLYSSADVLLATANTDAQGLYRFAALPPERYVLEFMLRATDEGDRYVLSSLDGTVVVSAGESWRTSLIVVDGAGPALTWDVSLTLLPGEPLLDRDQRRTLYLPYIVR
jgi:hypothetical protein